ncbi:2'-5' RNA ligase [Thermoplasmatales archaeon BRNA1]|nr:2'-5' RNA ligase [Thermoplasmatales archaeon BRNA1]
MVRVFVSIPVPNISDLAPFLKDIGAVRGVRPVSAVQLHITLAFVGEVDEERIDDIAECVEAEVREKGSARITLKGAGAFPSEKRPRVIWAGVETGLPLEGIAAGIRRRFAAKGIPFDEKPFKAHITVGRVDRPTDVSGLIGVYRRTEFFSFICRSVMVVRSDLSPSGPTYTILRVCDL